MLVGYARVSTPGQGLGMQADALREAGCEGLYTDVASGAKAAQPGLAETIDYVRSGDTPVVWRLDRLGRSLLHLTKVVRGLHDGNVGFRALQQQVDTTTASEKLAFHVFGALAEFERELIRERTAAGLKAAGTTKGQMMESESSGTYQEYSTSLPELELQAIDRLLASHRAWEQFRDHADKLHRHRRTRLQNGSRALSKVEDATRLWLDTVGWGEASGGLTPPHCFLMRVQAVETLHERRWFDGLYDDDLKDIQAGLEAIRQREGLEEEDWPVGQGPKDWEALETEYVQVLDAKFEEALRECDLHEIACLHRSDRAAFDERREQGRRLIFEGIPELERLSGLLRQLETEVDTCVGGGAYLAASVMIGSAIEAALLFACLNRAEDAEYARAKLPDGKRPNSKDAKNWTLIELTRVAGQAGWLPNFQVGNMVLLSRGLVDMVRRHRNLVHPARHISDGGLADVKRQFEEAQAAYTLLKRHLIAPGNDTVR